MTQTLTGRLTDPPSNTHANGDLQLTFEPDPGCPLPARVEFWAYYASALDGEQEAQLRWHRVGVDGNGADGWSQRWDIRYVPEGPVWLHAWAVDEAGRVGKGSPIRTGVTVDHHPPLGYVVGLQPGQHSAGTIPGKTDLQPGRRGHRQVTRGAGVSRSRSTTSPMISAAP